MIHANIKIKKFGDREILRDIDFCLEEGDFTVLMGPSGCGKTTLFNILNHFDKDYIGELDSNVDASIIFQKSMLLDMLTIYENLKIVNDVLEESQIDAVLLKLGISHIKYNTTSQCSIGELQRAMIARSLLSGSKVIFADEPTSSLDFANTEKIMKILQELNNEGYTIFLITHSLYCATYGKKIILLQDKKIEHTILLSDSREDNENIVYEFIKKNMGVIL